MAQRRFAVGTGWKMNIGARAAGAYAETLLGRLASDVFDFVDVFVLPPFTSLHEAHAAFGDRVGIGGQNMHWATEGAWTGEIGAPMLVEAGCRYVELAHSERLQHFGETYESVARKVETALAHDLIPILCLGETADEQAEGRADDVLTWQVETALAKCDAAEVPTIVLAYEPRWAIGGTAAASPDYVAERHAMLRHLLATRYGAETAQATRILYGGSVSGSNAAVLMALDNVDGLFVGRAAWSPDGFADIVAIVAKAARRALSA